LLEKLHKNYMDIHEKSAPKASEGNKDTADTAQGKRKPNYFDRKRFVDYE
jgi:hypothetical protein